MDFVAVQASSVNWSIGELVNWTIIVYFMDSINLPVINGVVGTSLGVILGFILNSLSRVGRLKVFQNELTTQFTQQCSDTGQELHLSYLTDKTDSLTILADFDFYNSSSQSPKIARNIKFIVSFKSFISDPNLHKYNNKIQFASNDSRERNLNLGPESVVSFELSFYSRAYFQEILDADWHLEFHNNRNKIRRIKIDKGSLKKKVKLSELLRQHKECIIFKG